MPPEPMDLSGRRIVVTGAASGIGRAVAELLWSRGASLALLDIAADAVALPEARPAQVARIAACDVAQEDQVSAAVASLAQALGGLDGVVNCAGVSLRRSIDETTAADWDRVIGINLTGTFNICRAAVPHLRKAGGGTVVNIASGAAFRPSFHFAAYCASKGGVLMFSRALALDLAADGIRVNTVCPGVVDTPMIDRAISISPDPDAASQRFLQASAMGRLGHPDEIAQAVLFLTSDCSSYMTGAAVSVDGGGAYH